MNSMTLEVLRPTGLDVTSEKSLGAHRVETLDGKRIGLVWNNKDYGDKVLDQVHALLAERLPSAKFSRWRLKECCIKPPEGELEKIAKEVDAVVYTLGD
jgi:hypothetical protein